VAELAAQGTTDYVAYCNRLGGALVIGEMDCVFSSWTTDRPEGFSEFDLSVLDQVVPCMASAIVGSSLGRIADTLVETYLGRDAGRRVLRGTIERGVAEKLHAVLWFSDLKGFTRLVDTVAAEQVIPLLNEYADAIVSSIHEHGGQVLKFIGDGMLATFEARDPAAACGQALRAARAALQRVEELKTDRAARQLPVTGFYLALHVGEVFYGNIGSAERLDFTVVGPAVNEVSRIAGMSRSLEQDVLLSSAFAEAAGDAKRELVALGRYALRGVARPQELFTLDRSD
jgi:adenylate cyclase